MPTPTRSWRPRAVLALLSVLAVSSAACGDDTSTAGPSGESVTTAAPDPNRVLKISAIPDQDPAKLATINQTMATYLGGQLTGRSSSSPSRTTPPRSACSGPATSTWCSSAD